MTVIPVIKVPYKGTRTTRQVWADWPQCPEHECNLVQRHPHSIYLWCSEGHHFVSRNQAIFKKVLAYEIEQLPLETT